jgi:heavy metal sensor kinase
MTLTTRLSSFFLSALAAVLAAFSVALYLLADRYLYRQLNDRLEAAARTLAAAVEVEPDGVEWEPNGRPYAISQGMSGSDARWVVLDGAGRIVDRSGSDESVELAIAAPAAFAAGHHDPRRIELAGSPWQATLLRIGPETLPPSGVPAGKHASLVVAVAVPLEQVQTTLRTLAFASVALTVSILLIAGLAGRRVCRRALAPVVKMADATRDITAADMARRLPVPPADDELSGLGRAFNQLLDRLQEAYERERRFAGEASHQLRTPLTALIGQLEVSLRRDRNAEEYREVVRTALGQASRLHRVVEALLFLARSEKESGPLALEPIDLSSWLPERFEEWRRHPRAADLILKPEAPGSVYAQLHADLFGESLDALIDNALKYSSPGNRVIIRYGNGVAGVWLEVADQGCGIEPADIPRLFQPFFRAESARKRGVTGAGLGLAVAQRIIAAHQAAVQVESRPGDGTTVRIRFSAPT